MARRKNAAPEGAHPPMPPPGGRHAVLEASAGTGKTYAMVEEVKRLLVEDGLRLSQILVLTFTEKAAAELRRRVRAGLKAAVQAKATPPAAAAAYRAALAAWPQAAIFTLHGFCNRVLHEFGFENDMPFQLAQVNDGEVFEAVLRDLQRRVWPEWYGDRLPLMLALSGYPARRLGVSDWERQLLQLAGEVRIGAGMRLEPAGAEQFQPGDLATAAAALTTALQAIGAELEAGDLSDQAGRWFDGFALNSRMQRAAAVKHLTALLTAGASAAAWAAALNTRARDGWELEANTTKYLHKLLGEAADNPARDRLLRGFAALAAWQQALGRAQYSLMIRTLTALQPAAKQYKLERGLLSFDDMIEEVARQVSAPAAHADDAGSADGAAPAADDSALLTVLRARYQAALVDEFQDTDLLQWRILQRVFVAGGGAHRLTLIGDPKQSIYRFRRADIHTYLQAREEIGGGRATRTLGVNWRSTPELIAALNRFFGGVDATGQRVAPDWFFEDRTQIAFAPVSAPGAEERRSRLTVDRTGRGPITVLRQPADKVGLQRWRQARWIAAEIARLLRADGADLQFATGDSRQPTRALQAGDIAILTPRRKMIPALLQALQAAGIPASTYKQAGLFASDEALAVITVLRAIERPGDRARLKAALLTPFFGCRPEQVERFDGFTPQHPAPQLFARWAQWAAERRYSRLAASLLRETGVIGRALAEADGDRRLSNLRQVLEYFGEAAYGRKLDLPAAIRAVELAAEQNAVEETDVQRIDTERSKVQIMTIHASKGLEFPVVFLSEVADPNGAPAFRWQFHAPEDHMLVYDLAKTEAHKPRHQAENEEEAARLYYVALTRARFKLFLPQFEGSRDPLGFGLRLTQVFPPPTTGASTAADGVGWLDWDDSLATVTPLARPAPAAAPLAPALEPPRDLARRRLAIESFTHLRSRWHGAAGQVGAFAGGGGEPGGAAPAAEFTDRDLFDEAIDDRLEAALLVPMAGGEVRLEPGGVAFGTLVHDVLEAVDFAAVLQAGEPAALLANPAIAGLIETAATRAYGPAGAAAGLARRQAAVAETARLVWLALNTPLPIHGGEFPGVPLATLPAGDCLCELEFQYAVAGAAAAGGAAAGAGGDGQIYGFIDLLFRHRPAPDRPYQYFLLDWKTNRLDDYQPATLEQCMQAEGYHLQHRLYTLGMVDWLAGRLPGFDPARDFGGVVYLFLRGLNGRDAATGVFFAPLPPAVERAALRENLLAALAGAETTAPRRADA